MKRFETFIGDKWSAWTETETVKIKKSGRTVVITTEARPSTPDVPGHDRLVTTFNLDILPAYTVA